MLPSKERVDALCTRVDSLRRSRYKVLVVYGAPLTGKTTLAKAVCSALNGRYVDITGELLPNINDPVLGVYGPSYFVKWIATQAEQGGFLCLDEIEGLLGTFGREGSAQFFEILKQLEVKAVVMVVTHLDNIVARAAFSRQHLYSVGSDRRTGGYDG